VYPNTSLQFNLSHSGDFVAYAFAHGCKLGIDIEEVRPIPDRTDIARHLFSREEWEDWLGLTTSHRHEAFFRRWTRIEAYVKALGDGLSMPFDTFRVSFLPGAEPKLIFASDQPATGSTWALYSVEPAPGYVGALAVPDPARSVQVLPRMTSAEVLKSFHRSISLPPND
jgi:4'-phosphopantetheinyl transferase